MQAGGLRSFLLTGVALVFAASLVVVIGWIRYTNPGPLTESRTIIIPRGSGVDDIAHQLWHAGILGDPYSFILGVRIDGNAPRLRSGEYAFAARVAPRDAAGELASGHTVIRRLTVPEGLTTAQVLALIQTAEGLEGEIGPTPAEGALLPETFFYTWGDSRRQVVARAERAMSETVAQLWANRAPNLPLRTPEEAVILASIVEKETALPAERPHVAGVFLNRLKQSMRLQADPTVIYGLTHGQGPLDRPLTHVDLESTSKWNTYTIDGLPPTPIDNPGRASLEAVMQPADTDDLYFVADGMGRHVFAKTLAEHNRNVARLREVERRSQTAN
jgi:peptidoglycan lytic transglycosylase G